MKYAIYNSAAGAAEHHGDYWREVNFNDHLKLTGHQTTFQYFIKNYPPPREVLDAGCGLGRWILPLAEMGYKAYGIEKEPEAVAYLQKNYSGQNVEIIEGDAFRMPYRDKSFDVVFSLGVVEHFRDREAQVRLLKEHSRILKEDGTLLLTVPYASLLRIFVHIPALFLSRLYMRARGKPGRWGFTEYRYSKGEIKRIVMASGFTVKKIIYDELLPPYNFGLTFDWPFFKLMTKKEGSFLLNKFGRFFFNVLWNIYPGTISSGIGLVCQHQKKHQRSVR